MKEHNLEQFKADLERFTAESASTVDRVHDKTQCIKLLLELKKLQATLKSADASKIGIKKAGNPDSGIHEPAASPSLSTKNAQSVSTDVNGVDPLLFESIQAALNSRTEELTALHEKHKNALIEIEEFKLKEAEIREEETSGLSHRLLHLQKSIDALNDQNGSLKKHLSRLESELEESFEKRKNFQYSIQGEEAGKRHALESKIEFLEHEVSRLRTDRDNARNCLEQSKSKLDALRSSTAYLQSAFDKLKVLNDSLVSENASLKQKCSFFDMMKEKNSVIPEKLSQQIKTEEAYASELEAVAKAFEELTEQNSKLQTKLNERDDKIAFWKAEKLKYDMWYSNASKEKDVLQKSLSEFQERYGKYGNLFAGDVEASIKSLNDRTAELERDSSLKDNYIDSLKRKISEQSVAISEITSKYEALAQMHNAIKESFSGKEARFEDMAFAKRRLAEENAILSKKLHSFENNPSAVSKDVLEQLDIYRKLLKCSSCNLHDKQVALNRCMHVFCKECIDIRLETRQRKCPLCLDPFGANDVRTIYL